MYGVEDVINNNPCKPGDIIKVTEVGALRYGAGEEGSFCKKKDKVYKARVLQVYPWHILAFDGVANVSINKVDVTIGQIRIERMSYYDENGNYIKV